MFRQKVKLEVNELTDIEQIIALLPVAAWSAIYTLLGIVLGILVMELIHFKNRKSENLFNLLFGLNMIVFAFIWLLIPNQIQNIGILATLVVALLTFKTVDEMKLSRIAQSRPEIIIDFDIPFGHSIINLVIRNEGKSLAKNITFQVTPELIDTNDRNLSKGYLFEQGIKTMIAGKEIKQIFDGSINYYEGNKKTPEKYPLIFNAKINYEDNEGIKYEDSMILNLELYKDILYTTEGSLKDIAEELKDIERELSRHRESQNRTIA